MLERTLSSLRPLAVLGGLGTLAFAGCSSSGTAAPAVTHPTLIEVAPEDFLGDVPCAPSGPGLQRYVATIQDRDFAAGGAPNDGGAGGDSSADEGGAQGFQLPSSQPTPCRAGVGFGFVVPGRHYEVFIDGYDTSDLAPRAEGSRQMVSPAEPSDAVPLPPLLAPRWQAKCTRAIAVSTTIVRADHCQPFQASDPAAPGAVRVRLGALLGGLRCGSDAGQVDHFVVSLKAGITQSQMTVSCSSKASAVFEELAPRQRAAIYVSAFSAGSSDAFAGAGCNALTVPDARVDARCDALSTLGTLRVDLPSALGLLGVTCSAAELSRVDIDVPGEAGVQSVFPPDCLVPFEQAFPAGPAAVTLTAVFQSDPERPEQALGSLTCHGEVAPGTLTSAGCELNPAD